MHPIIQLLQRQSTGDFNIHFYEALEALIFLSNPTKEDLDEKILFNIETSFIEKIQPHHAIQVTNDVSLRNQETESYNVMDFLIVKLIQNLRRIYAANKSSQREAYPEKHLFSQHETVFMKNKDGLLLQQELIYKTFSLLKDKLSFDMTPKIFTKAIFGKDIYALPIDLFIYLGLHSSIEKPHFSIHMDVLKTITPTDYKIGAGLISYLKKVVHTHDKKELLDWIYSHTDLNDLFQSTFYNEHHQLIKTNTWFVGLLEHLIEHNFSLSLEQKTTVIYHVVNSKVLDSVHLIDFFQNKAIESQFIERLSFYLGGEDTSSIYQQVLETSLPLVELHQTKTADFIMSHISALDSPFIIKDVLTNKLMKKEQKETILHLYDFHSIEFLKQVFDLLDEKQHDKPEFLYSFFELHDNTMSKEMLAYIISKNPSYFELCKPAYLKLLVSESLPEHSSNESILVKSKL